MQKKYVCEICSKHKYKKNAFGKNSKHKMQIKYNMIKYMIKMQNKCDLNANKI